MTVIFARAWNSLATIQSCFGCVTPGTNYQIICTTISPKIAASTTCRWATPSGDHITYTATNTLYICQYETSTKRVHPKLHTFIIRSVYCCVRELYSRSLTYSIKNWQIRFFFFLFCQSNVFFSFPLQFLFEILPRFGSIFFVPLIV